MNAHTAFSDTSQQDAPARLTVIENAFPPVDNPFGSTEIQPYNPDATPAYGEKPVPFTRTEKLGLVFGIAAGITLLGTVATLSAEKYPEQEKPAMVESARGPLSYLPEVQR